MVARNLLVGLLIDTALFDHFQELGDEGRAPAKDILVHDQANSMTQSKLGEARECEIIFSYCHRIEREKRPGFEGWALAGDFR